MTLRAYLTIMILATVICWGVFIFITKSVDPYETNWIGFVLFYSSLFLSVIGSAAVIGFIVRFIGLKKELVFYSVKAAFRQAFILGVLVVAVMYLKANGWFTWLNLILLVSGLSILEYIMLSLSRENYHTVVAGNVIDDSSEAVEVESEHNENSAEENVAEEGANNDEESKKQQGVVAGKLGVD